MSEQPQAPQFFTLHQSLEELVTQMNPQASKHTRQPPLFTFCAAFSFCTASSFSEASKNMATYTETEQAKARMVSERKIMQWEELSLVGSRGLLQEVLRRRQLILLCAQSGEGQKSCGWGEMSRGSGGRLLRGGR